ncbi:Protein tweety [Armadillidium nasatum]|uniref:Protein tweety homolog n=1 Tax=Armadillidium nasatum TaxID=96803 RepID=A0A5N5SRS8_9CRUS|nr:Protein tweety [Armadillidium nasatum]
MQDFRVTSEAVIRRVFWVEWFHRAPHINLTLQKVNSTFDPFSPVYQEVNSCEVPAGILILTLLILLLYLLTRCCDNKPRKPGSIACLKATCVLTALFTLGALGVTVWGNEEVHNGMSEAIYSLGTINNMVHSLSNKTKIFDETIQRNLEPELNLFKDTVEKHKIENTTAQMYIIETLFYVKGNISDVLLINVEDIRAKLNRANLTEVVRALGFGELIRWVATLALTGLLMMVVLIVPLGVARHSRCTLITFSVLGLISLIVCWALTSLYLVLNVIHPRLDRLDTYVKQSQRTLGAIAALLECQSLHQQYLSMLNATCYQAVSGFVYLLLSAAGSGFFFTVLVWFTSHTWIYLNNKSEGQHNWSDRDRYVAERGGGVGGGPRLPPQNPSSNMGGRPRHSHTPPQTPPFPGTLNGRLYNSDSVGGMIGPGGGSGGSMGGTLGGNGGPPSLVNTTSSRGSHNHTHNHGHSHQHNHSHPPLGPNQGQYATLSKQCKTLESSDFY